jgi:hypothetical protein
VDSSSYEAVVAAGAEATGESSDQDRYLSFAPRNERFGSANYGPLWEVHTAHSHPSWTSAQPYTTLDSEGDIVLLSEPLDEPFEPYRDVAIPLIDALAAFNRVIVGHPLTADLRVLIARAYELDTVDRATRGVPRPPEYDDPILPGLD